jgi:uncharacterized membrane protein YqiK
MNAKALLAILSIWALALNLSSPAWAAKAKTAEDVQINSLIQNARTKADHEKIAQMLEQEAKDEEAKAQSLKDQAEAYKEHKHGLYGKDMADLWEHTIALSHHYEDSAKRHRGLAEIHRRIASEIK